MEVVSFFLFKCFTGFMTDDTKRWHHYWKRMIELEDGEMVEFEITHPRHSMFHRRHMKIERNVFNAQDKFTDFEVFRDWTKVGAAWVIWCAGPTGGVVPIPKSVSYKKADEAQFRTYHAQVIEFYRGPHASIFLWKHLGVAGSAQMMDAVLKEFDE